MCRDKLVAQVEHAKCDLQQRIEKDVKDNTILQVSLKRKKQILHKQYLKLEKDVSKLQKSYKPKI